MTSASPPSPQLPPSVDAVADLLSAGGYIADRDLATVIFLALRLGRPLLLEGEAGVGKTEVAKVLASTLSRKLIRLQCYEGLDAAAALYEWDHARQLLAIRLAEAAGESDRDRLAAELFSPRYLLKRPLLQALEPAGATEGGPPVLLLDEVDRADEPFEAFLLEILSDFQVTIPELGTVRCQKPPLCILTSNRTREIHDALKRRCLYHFLGYPDAARELAIVKRRAPAVAEGLSRQVVAVVQRLRTIDLFKPPGVAETLDWVSALVALERTQLDAATFHSTLGAVLKYQDDIAKVAGPLGSQILSEVHATLGS
jgi:MoxR-like ATPase